MSKQTLTDIKTIYNDFKFFKGIYTKINLADKLTFVGKKDQDEIDVYFHLDSQFSKLFAKIKGNIKLFDWLRENNTLITVRMEDLISIGKCLKKNVISLEYDDDYFDFNYNDKDGNPVKISMKKEKIASDFSTLSNDFCKEIIIDSSYFKSDIFQVFSDYNGGISNKRTTDKIIEISTGMLNAYLKDAIYAIQFTEKDEIESRFVMIKSKSDDLGLELIEVFRTI